MKNYVQSGKIIDYANPNSTAIQSGDVVIINKQIGVAAVFIDILANSGVGAVNMVGVFNLAKATGETWAQGDELFWDSVALAWTKTPSANAEIQGGYAWSAQASGDVLGLVRLTPSGSGASAASVAAVATANATDLATAEALANQLKTSVNAILVALKAAGLMQT